MTYEAVLIIETELPIPLTCAEGTGIAKGTALKIADLATVSASTGDEDLCGGINGSEKIASDGMVRTDVYRGGIFRVYASGAIKVGDSVAIAEGDGTHPNHFKVHTALMSGSRIWGLAFEEAGDQESFLMELRPGAK